MPYLVQDQTTEAHRFSLISENDAANTQAQVGTMVQDQTMDAHRISQTSEDNAANTQAQVGTMVQDQAMEAHRVSQTNEDNTANTQAQDGTNQRMEARRFLPTSEYDAANPQAQDGATTREDDQIWDWDEHYAKLKEVKKKHGYVKRKGRFHKDVPNKTRNWCGGQIKYWKKRSGKQSNQLKKRINLLIGIGAVRNCDLRQNSSQPRISRHPLQLSQESEGNTEGEPRGALFSAIVEEDSRTDGIPIHGHREASSHSLSDRAEAPEPAESIPLVVDLTASIKNEEVDDGQFTPNVQRLANLSDLDCSTLKRNGVHDEGDLSTFTDSKTLLSLLPMDTNEKIMKVEKLKAIAEYIREKGELHEALTMIDINRHNQQRSRSHFYPPITYDI